MKRFGGWLGSIQGANAPTNPTPFSHAEELRVIQEVEKHLALVLNDEVDQAEELLAKGDTPFHLLGHGFCLLIRSTSTLDKDTMERTGVKLGEAAASAAEYHKRANRDTSNTFQSKVYPVGSEYALIQAISPLMACVVAVLGENITECLRCFLKLRKAIATLQSLNEAEKKYLEKYPPPSKNGVAVKESSSAADSLLEPSTDPTHVAPQSGEVSDDEADFVDAEEVPESISVNQPSQNMPTSSTDNANDFDIGTILTDPVDQLVHAGTAMSIGLINLILSQVPPTFARFLALFAFHGDRKTGIRLLSSASNSMNTAFGAISGLVLLVFHSFTVYPSDIVCADTIPYARIHFVINEAKRLFPDALMWVLEDARLAATERRLEYAAETLQNRLASPFAFASIGVIATLEYAQDLMHLSRFEDSAAAFERSAELGKSKDGSAFFMAAANYVQAYREYKTTDVAKAATLAARAEESFSRAVSPKSRGNSFNTYSERRLARWRARAQTTGCALVDAVGSSPVEELNYILAGYRRMQAAQLESSLTRLQDEQYLPQHASTTIDDLALHALLKATVLRNLHRVSEAKEVLTKEVLCFSSREVKAAAHAVDFVLPAAHYEMAVCAWEEAGGEGGDVVSLRGCKKEVDVCAGWERYLLDGRFGFRVANARESLRRCGIE